MEVKTNMIAKEVKYMCDECGTGEMVFTEEVNPRLNKTKKHKCSNCECVVYFRDQYPHMVYEES